MKLTNLYESDDKSVKDLYAYLFEDRYMNDLDIRGNWLVSLDGSPLTIRGGFDCSNNK